ncbi:MAG TPA: hypothetical protein VFJ82_14485 [Longimicrobium sp.]|nr:hypothetical protein [Longimicrobium sp.]
MIGRKKGWVAAAVVAAAVGCSEPLDIGSFSVEGQWKGNVAQAAGTDSARYSFTFDLDQNESDVSGTATIQSGTQTVEADVDGTWAYPNVTLRLTADGYAPLDYAAQFPNARRDTLRGPLTGSGFVANTTLTIVRQ